MSFSKIIENIAIEFSNDFNSNEFEKLAELLDVDVVIESEFVKNIIVDNPDFKVIGKENVLNYLKALRSLKNYTINFDPANSRTDGKTVVHIGSFRNGFRFISEIHFTEYGKIKYVKTYIQ